MAILLGAVLFVAGNLVIVLAMGTLVLPLAYFLPKTVLWVARGWARWPALARCIILIGVWLGLFLVVPMIMRSAFPSAARAIASSLGWKFGQSVGFLFSVMRLFGQGRLELRRDFERGLSRHLTDAGAVRVELNAPVA